MTHLRSYRGIFPKLGQGVYLDPCATVVGQVHLDDDVSVWPFASVRGDTHSISVGKRSNIQDNAVLHCTHASNYNPEGWPLKIGADVTIGHGACLHGCTIGDRVLIGIQAVVLDGAVVPDNVILGAKALVPPRKALESGFLYVGSPCKKARPLDDKERDFLAYSAHNYMKLKNEYLAAAKT